MTLHAAISLAYSEFTLDVELDTRSHVTGVFGPSGCGKSTLIDAVAGLRPEANGVVTFGDACWQDSEKSVYVPTEDRGIGYVPQTGLLFPHLTVKGNLEVGFRRARHREQDPGVIYRKTVELMELSTLLDRRPDSLSGGERQRVALARALCSSPSIMLLDEPLAALDRPMQRKILPFLRRIREESDVPVLLVSHDPVEVQAICDDVVVMRNGRVIAQGEPNATLTDPSVFALAGARDFENIVPGTVTASDETGCTIALGDVGTGVSLSLIAPSTPIGSACLVGIPARDVMLATERPRGLSARNHVPATVESIHDVDGYKLVSAKIAPNLPTIAVEIGRSAAHELAIAPGRAVFLVIKASSGSIYPAPP